MATQRIYGTVHILHSRLLESGSGLADTVSVAAYRVIAACNEEYRELLVHGSQIFRLLDKANAT